MSQRAVNTNTCAPCPSPSCKPDHCCQEPEHGVTQQTPSSTRYTSRGLLVKLQINTIQWSTHAPYLLHSSFGLGKEGHRAGEVAVACRRDTATATAAHAPTEL